MYKLHLHEMEEPMYKLHLKVSKTSDFGRLYMNNKKITEDSISYTETM